jgi:hypothetical protein
MTATTPTSHVVTPIADWSVTTSGPADWHTFAPHEHRNQHKASSCPLTISCYPHLLATEPPSFPDYASLSSIPSFASQMNPPHSSDTLVPTMNRPRRHMANADHAMYLSSRGRMNSHNMYTGGIGPSAHHGRFQEL